MDQSFPGCCYFNKMCLVFCVTLASQPRNCAGNARFLHKISWFPESLWLVLFFLLTERLDFSFRTSVSSLASANKSWTFACLALLARLKNSGKIIKNEHRKWILYIKFDAWHVTLDLDTSTKSQTQIGVVYLK